MVPIVISNQNIQFKPTNNIKPTLDSEPPEFGNNFTKNIAYTSNSFNFTINITDNVGLDQVYVNYTWLGAGQYFNKSMINISGNWTNITLMPIINTTITYYFWANDTSGNSNKTGFGFVTVLDDDPPVIISGSDNFTVGTGNNFVIYSNFTDNVNVLNAEIYFKKITAGSYSSAGMTEGSEGQFYATNIFLGIDTTNDVTGYYYYVIAKDANNNSVNYTFNQTNKIPWTLNVQDDDPPTLINGTGNFTITTGFGFTIYANFTDNLGANNVSTVKIFYKKTIDAIYTSKLMQNFGPGKFQINNTTMGINTLLDDNDYLYYFWVNDTIGNNATYPFNYVFNITVLDDVYPQSINGSGDIIGYCSSGFTIFANFSDNINVNYSRIYYSYEENASYRNTLMNEGAVDGQFYITNISMDVNVYNNLTNLSYYVIGFDNDNNDARYNDTGGMDWNITIIDDISPTPISGSGNFQAETGIPFWLWANFTDNLNVTKATIYFKLQTETSYHQCNMTPADSNGSFYLTSDNISQVSCLDLYHSATPILYYVLAFDPFNNTGNYTNSGTDWVITVIDITPPELINLTEDFTITTGETFTIYGNFTDNINISHADLYFKRKTPAGSSTEYSSISMIEIGGKKGHFYVTKENLGIDTYLDDRDIFYHFIAYDEAGVFKLFRKPAGVDYKITVIDNDKPWVTSGNENITIGTGDTFEIFANFSDNINIDFVRLYYKKEMSSLWYQQDFIVNDDNGDKIWEYHISSSELDVFIDTTNDDSDYFYYLRVYDGYRKKPNVYNYTYGNNGFKINVTDDDAPTSAKPYKGSGNMKATTGEPFIIYANFTDNIEVDIALIFIKLTNSDPTWPMGIVMVESANAAGKFYITNSDLNINTTSDDSDYEYYVECADATGNKFIYDNKGESFEIDVLDNDPPLSKAGPNQIVEEGKTVYFNANSSNDNIGIVYYSWEFIYENLEIKLEDEKSDFTFERYGNYLIILTVRDMAGNDAKDDIWVNVSEKNYPPKIVDFRPEKDSTIYVFKVKPSDLYVRFNESIKIDDIDNIDFFFMTDSSGIKVEGIFSWSESSYKLSFTPSSDLIYNENYQMTVTTNVTDKTDIPLQTGLIWSFTTHPEDSDGDSLADEWEVKHFGRDTDYRMWITQVGPTDDPDKDEFTNLEEHDAGTNPTNSKSYPPIDKKDDVDAFNYLFFMVMVILIIIVVIILITAIMIIRKRKVEEEESKKPKPIVHEILFDEGGADLGPGLKEPGPGEQLGPAGPTTEPTPEPSPEQALETPDDIGIQKGEEVKLEPGLETETSEMVDGTQIEEHDIDIVEPGVMDIAELPSGDEKSMDRKDRRLEEDIDEIDDSMTLKAELGEEPIGDLDNVNTALEEDLEKEMEAPAEELFQNYLDTGKRYFEAGNYSDAILEWQKALDIQPDNQEINELMKNGIDKMKE
jgi:hypothetical protein